MASKQIEHKLRLAQLADSIRKKFNALKYGETDYQMQMERKFKPLLNYQQQQQQQQRQHIKLQNQKNFIKQENDLLASIKFEDNIYGVKCKNNGSLFLGNFPISIIEDSISVHDKTYTLTKGLLSLLSKKLPLDYTEEDLQNYKDMLEQTNAHLTKQCDRLKYCRGEKYQKIIQPLFKQQQQQQQQNTPQTGLREIKDTISRIKKNIQSSLRKGRNHRRRLSFSSGENEDGEDEEERLVGSSSSKSGTGFMKVIKGVRSLRGFYWNDPNELAERLILLHASKAAGNTNVINEILAIEEELREAGIIK